MKRVGVGLSFAAVLGLVACASEEIDQALFGGKGGNAASGGSHAGSAGRGGSTSSPHGGSGQVSQGGTGASAAGASQSGAGVPGVGGTGGLVGASGSPSAGGSAASGGASPVFESGMCASSPSMSLSYQQASNNPKQITGHYQFSNTTDTPIPLAQLRIRYFFSNEETSGWKTSIYDSKLEGGTDGYRPISGSTLVVSPLGAAVPGADSYFELSFSSGLSIEKGATATVSWDLQPQSYSPPDQVQADDYSYNAAAVAYTVWDHVVIYQGNTLVWGCTPKEAGGGAGGAATGGSSGLGGSGGADSGGASGAGVGGTAGANAGTGGDTTNGGSAAGGASGTAGMAGSTLGGASGTAGMAGSTLGGASGNSAIGGAPWSAGTSGSGGSSGAI